MKFLSLALVVGAASAFTTPPMTFAVGKKTPAKKAAMTKPVPAKKAATKVVAKKTKAVAKAAPKPKPVAKKAAPKPVAKKAAPKPKPVARKVVVKRAPPPVRARNVGTVPSIAIPGEDAPALLDGSMVGDVGFDPCFLSTRADSVAPYFNKLFAGNAPIDGLTWYREAELMHGRICMVATVGFIWPGISHFGGNEWTGADAFATTNPLEAFSAAPSASLFQIFAFMAGMEFRRIGIILEDGKSYMAGDSQRWGQGAGRWNPCGFDYSPAEYKEKQLQELKHARAAMIGFLGVVFQANASGVSVAEQWGAAFTAPEYAAKAGYFLPVGI